MEPKIKALFQDDILEVSKTLYDMDLNSCQFLGGFESFVYEYRFEDKAFILKISHSSHRTQSQIESEFDFVNHLYQQGASVSKPILNRHHRFTHTYPLDEGYFTISSTEKALGNRPTDLLTNRVIQHNYGKTIGLFHHLTMSYEPKISIEKRFTWVDDPLIVECRNYLDESDGFVYDEMIKVMDQIQKIPQTMTNYGLIHTDIHRSNFLVQEDQTLTVFDFDDAAYFYFMSDIAIAIFYTLFFMPNKDEVAEAFILQLMQGYQETHPMSKADFLTIPLFLRFRTIVLYLALKRSTQKTDPFTMKYNGLYLDSIQQNLPFLQVDFEMLYQRINRS